MTVVVVAGHPAISLRDCISVCAVETKVRPQLSVALSRPRVEEHGVGIELANGREAAVEDLVFGVESVCVRWGCVYSNN